MGLALAHEKYGSGKFTLAQLITPAIKFAREGFPVEDDLADSLHWRGVLFQALNRWSDARADHREALRLL